MREGAHCVLVWAGFCPRGGWCVLESEALIMLATSPHEPGRSTCDKHTAVFTVYNTTES